MTNISVQMPNLRQSNPYLATSAFRTRIQKKVTDQKLKAMLSDVEREKFELGSESSPDPDVVSGSRIAGQACTDQSSEELKDSGKPIGAMERLGRSTD